MRIINKFHIAQMLGAFILLVSASIGYGQNQDEIRELLPNQTIEREMTGAQTHRYKFDLKQNEFFQVRAEQKGVDVMLKLTDASGNVLATMDSPNSKEGSETLSFIALKAGSFVLQVIGFDEKAETGKYTLKREPPRTATIQDKRRVEVERLFIEGITARDEQGQTAIALKKLEESLDGWRELKDEYMVGLISEEINQLKQIQKEQQVKEEKAEIAFKIFEEGSELLNQLTLESLQKAREKFKIVLNICREIGEKNGEFLALLGLARISDLLGENSKALEEYNSLLPQAKLLENKSIEGTILNNIGLIYSDWGEQTKALQFFDQSLILRRAANDLVGVSQTLFNVGGIYADTGDKKKALETFEQALIIAKKNEDIQTEAILLGRIGLIYSDFGDYEKAFQFNDKALFILKNVQNKKFEAEIISNNGLIYAELGFYKKAIDLFNQALATSKKIGSKELEAATINNIGNTFQILGEYGKAIEFFDRALIIFREIGYNNGEATTLSNLSICYIYLNETEKALESLKKSLELSTKSNNVNNTATVLNNIAQIYSRKGELQVALNFSNQALTLVRGIGNKSKEATLLNNIGIMYFLLGENDKALTYFQQSLPVSKSIKDKSQEAKTLDSLQYYWHKSNNPKFAVFYGKQAINLLQELRANIQELDKDTQKKYLKSVAYIYRNLVGILIAQGRIAEAEQVLGMLKEDEYFSYLRRDDKVSADLKGRISLSADEKKAFEEYEKYADEITRAAQEFEDLKKKIPFGGTVASLSADEQKRYKELENQYNAAVTVFNKFLDDLKIRFGKTDVRVEKVESDTIGLLKSLNQPRTVIISTIVGEDRLNLIVTTSEVQRAHTVEVKAEDLNKLVAEFRQALINPSVDPRPAGKKLYDILFPAALQKDLANINADTIVWSLDGTLRYVPMSALWDGEKYLVERYANAIITLASRDKLASTGNNDRRNWTAFGVGVSKSFENFEALPAVPKELCSVVKDAKNSDFCGKLGETGVFGGLMLRDEEFTLELFQPNLGKTPLVHIASHFALNPGEYDASFLLLGGGANRRFSLKNLRETRLDGIELLTLSACNTAMTSGNQTNGLEVEGFGALAQKQGVKSVLATLWSVADDSTGTMMTEFYRQMQSDTQLGKAEALRQVQIKMISGKLKPSNTNSGCRSGVYKLDGKTETPYKCDANAPFSHPFFWSPFILFGNWK